MIDAYPLFTVTAVHEEFYSGRHCLWIMHKTAPHVVLAVQVSALHVLWNFLLQK